MKKIKSTWPYDYKAVAKRRDKLWAWFDSESDRREIFEEKYKDHAINFIQDWCYTYNPRNVGTGIPVVMPFLLFDKQREMVRWLNERVENQDDGLCEKSRDMGATWLCVAYSVWLWRFHAGSAVGWGSRKQDLVDRIGDPDSIFEKIRIILKYLPNFALPLGFKEKEHSHMMRLVNPENGASITGEVGDNIGRGGRKLIYFKDEAQPLDAKILTPSGWQTMGDMHVGSIVCGPDGGRRSVTHINDVGMHDVYRVTLNDGSYTECSLNHIWTVDKVLGKKERLNLRTKEIIENFKYTSPRGQVMYRYRLPSTNPVNFVTDNDLPLDPYIVGALIGDGSVNSGGISFTSADDEVVENISTRLPYGCAVTKCSDGYGYRIVDIVRYNKSSRARNAVKASGIFGTKAENKRIPKAYLFGSIEQRVELLQGLMDTDGSSSGGTCTYHTCSQKLAKDIRFLVQSLGGSASLNVKPDHRGYRDMYCLHIVLPRQFEFFKLTRKNKQVNSRKRAWGKTITSIEKVGRKKVRCITLDAADGLYLTDNCIVTHNSSHYERPEKIEAALGDNTNIQIDISSVNGIGNVFYRRRFGGYVSVFVMDWRDHPGKTQEWYDKRREKAEAEGLLHLFAQEVDRDYGASVEGIVIPSAWVNSAVDADERLNLSKNGNKFAGLDVADEGGDKNAIVTRTGMILDYADMWGEGDTGKTTRKAIFICRERKIKNLQYDCIGVGSGVKSEINRLKEVDEENVNEENVIPDGLVIVPWNAGKSPLDPDEYFIEDDDETPLNKNLFKNLKAQGWWQLRLRFERTHKAITEGMEFDPEDLISISSGVNHFNQLIAELSQPTYTLDSAGRIMINKKPPGTNSPNIADSVVECFWPAPSVEPEPEFNIRRLGA